MRMPGSSSMMRMVLTPLSPAPPKADLAPPKADLAPPEADLAPPSADR